jgi:hypothetical protein
MPEWMMILSRRKADGMEINFTMTRRDDRNDTNHLQQWKSRNGSIANEPRRTTIEMGFQTPT